MELCLRKKFCWSRNRRGWLGVKIYLAAARSRMSAPGHFQTKSDAALLPSIWSGSPTGADVLHLAFVLNNALGSLARLFSRSPLAARRQSLPSEALGKGLGVFRLAKQNTTKSLSSRRRE
jgi:hypothetical protein